MRLFFGAVEVGAIAGQDGALGQRLSSCFDLEPVSIFRDRRRIAGHPDGDGLARRCGRRQPNALCVQFSALPQPDQQNALDLVGTGVYD